MLQSEFTLEIEGFRGPLELLLDLIEQRKLHVSDISLARVADDYIHFIEDRNRVPLSETAQFVVVAATLLLIKSKSLLPSIELTTEEEEDIQELEYRLAQYAIIRKAARSLERRWKKTSYTPMHTPKEEVVFAPSSDITTQAFYTHVAQLAVSLPTLTKKPPSAKIAKEIRLDDVIESLTTRMRSAVKDSFRRITSGSERVEAIVSFLALLELVKRGTLSVQQDTNFADITLEHDEVHTPHYG